MADIFISYASEDRDRVRPLADALQQKGFNLWWDRSLAAGHDYTAVIERELKNAKAVIVVWTQGSAASTFVRDEAGRARDEGRLVPVLFDRVQIPLGFGSFQAEDFTKWNGGANAPQMQILEEALRAKLEGRDVDGGAVAAKRRRLMSRVRIVSLLTVVALVVGVAAGGKYLFAPPEVQQADLRATLLQLLADGKLTPEQAIQLAEILESGALGETQMAANGESPAAGAQPAPSDSMSSRTIDGEPAGPNSVALAQASFDADARESYRSAFLAVAQHPDAQVRLAAVQLAQPNTRDAGMQAMWAYAQSHPDDPLRDDIYLLCGAVGEQNNSPLGQRALEISANLQPDDSRAWRMLSRSYQRTNRGEEAVAAATVGTALEARAQGQTESAEQQLQEAAPGLRAPELRASVVTELGEIAESRNDFTSASARFAESYRLREQAAETAPNSGSAAGLEANAQQLVLALDRSGRTREACERLRQAQEEHDVAAPDQELLTRCQTQFRTRLEPRVELSPRLRESSIRRAPMEIQRAPATP